MERPASDKRRGAAVRRIVFRRDKPTRELFQVKFAFWAVLVGFFLFVALLLWGIITHEPSQNPLDYGGD